MERRMTEETIRRLYWFYRWGMRVLPVLLMAAHFICTLYCGGSIGGESIGTKAVETVAYVVTPAFLLPASYLLGLGRIWRLPFAYVGIVDALAISGETPSAAALGVIMTAMYAWEAARLAAMGKPR